MTQPAPQSTSGALTQHPDPPTSLPTTQAWGMGVWHLVSMPTHGAMHGGPLQAVVGLARGMGDLVQQTSFATVSSLLKYIRRARNALMALCPDEVVVAMQVSGSVR